MIDSGIKGGMGRHSIAKTIHIDKNKCGPCHVCKDNAPSLRYFHFPESSQESFHLWAKNVRGVEHKHCICQKCKLKLYRQFSHPADVVKSTAEPSCKEPRSLCSLSKVNKCFEPSARFLSDSQTELFAQCFGLNDISTLIDNSKLPICRSHNLDFLHYCKDLSKCSFCHTTLHKGELSHLRKSPDYDGVLSYLKSQKSSIPEGFTKDSFLCNKCFMLQYRRLCEVNSLSSKCKLRIISENKKRKFSDKPICSISESCLDKTIVFLIDEFLLLDKGIVLQDLLEKYKYFEREAVDTAASVELHCDKNANWLMNKIETEIGQFIECHLSSKKSGIVILRSGTNTTNAFVQALAQARSFRLKSEKEINRLNTTINLLVSEHEIKPDYCIEIAMKSLNQRLHNMAKKMMNEFGSVESTEKGDLRQFNINDFIEKFDPVLWNSIFMLTANKTEMDLLSSPKNLGFDWNEPFLGYGNSIISRADTRKLRCLFILCSMIYSATSGTCGRPLHLLVAETIFSQSGSKQLLNILNRLGISVSYDTLKRYIVEVVDSLKDNGIPDLIDPSVFAVTSIDNVDRLFNYASCRAGQKVNVMNATSFQAVIPKPSIGKDISSIPPLKRDIIPINSNAIRVIKIQGDGNCLFRSIAVALLPELKSIKCQRDIFGEAKDPRLSKFESEIAKAIRKETIETILDNINFYLELDPAILESFCLKNNGSQYASFYDRCINLLHNHKEYVGQPEVMAVSYSIRCPIQIFRNIDGQLKKVQSFGEDCFLSATPIKLLYHLESELSPGHYDLIIECDTENEYDNVYNNCNKNGTSIFTEWSKQNYLGDDRSFISELMNELRGGIKDDAKTTSSLKNSRRLEDFDFCAAHSSSSLFHQNVAENDQENMQLKTENFLPNQNEMDELKKLWKRLFFYTLKKHCVENVNPPSLKLPSF